MPDPISFIKSSSGSVNAAVVSDSSAVDLELVSVGALPLCGYVEDTALNADGDEYSFTGIYTSGYIPIDIDVVYRIVRHLGASNIYHCFYDSNKQLVKSYINNATVTLIKPPSNAVYMRVCGSMAYIGEPVVKVPKPNRYFIQHESIPDRGIDQDGIISNQQGVSLSNFITVDSGEVIAVTHINSAFESVCFYDESFEFLSSVPMMVIPTSLIYAVVPDNARYMIFPFIETNNTEFKRMELTSKELEDGFPVFVEGAAKTGFGIDAYGNEKIGNDGIYASSYIKVFPEKRYVLAHSVGRTSAQYVAFYDSDKAVIDTILAGPSSGEDVFGEFYFTTPKQCRFIRFTGLTSRIHTQSISQYVPKESEVANAGNVLLIIGDSWSEDYSVRGTTAWPYYMKDYCKYDIHNYARGGSQVVGDTPNWALNGNLLGQVNAAIQDTSFNHADVDTIIVEGGINDYRGGRSLETIAEYMVKHVDSLHAEFMNARIIVMTNYQFMASNELMALPHRVEDAVKEKAIFVDMGGWIPFNMWNTSDYVHPTQDAGHKVLCHNVLALLQGGKTYEANNCVEITLVKGSSLKIEATLQVREINRRSVEFCVSASVENSGPELSGETVSAVVYRTGTANTTTESWSVESTDLDMWLIPESAGEIVANDSNGNSVSVSVENTQQSSNKQITSFDLVFTINGTGNFNVCGNKTVFHTEG